jgi:ABC-type antimicrobial peptide transport system permease subunit
MSFLQFAWNNVRRNARAYSAYFLSSSFAIMIFFTYAIFLFHPDLAKSDLAEIVKIGMKAADYVIFIFSFLFILYSMGAFLKVRQKEFGILTMLGTEGRQLNRLIFLENVIIGAVSIVTGLGSGLLLAKVFLLIGAKVVDLEELPFYLPWEAIRLTVAAFVALFLLISLLTPFFVRQKRVLALLQGTSKPKPEPKASILLAFLSASSFIGAFYLMKQKLTQGTMILILLLILIGTYFLFTQLSVLVIRLLKKNRPFFWRGTNLLWVSEMAYKMKDNARMFFMITIVITMASSAVGLVLTLDQRNKRLFTDDPFSFSYYHALRGDHSQQEVAKRDIAKIDQELSRAGVKYEKVKMETIICFFQEVMNLTSSMGVISSMNVMRQSDYDHLTDVLQLERTRPLNPDEAILIIDKQAQAKEKAELKNLHKLTAKEGTVTVIKHVENTLMMLVGAPSSLAVVSDSTFDQWKQNKPESIQISYFVPAWSNSHLPKSNSLEAELSKKLVKWTQEEFKKGEFKGSFLSRAERYLLLKQATNAINFIGVFIAAIFSIFTASLLYFKLYTDLNQDSRIYYGLSKMGLSAAEMKKAVTIQMVILFFAPLMVAALETMIALSALEKELNMGSTFVPAMIGIGCFFAAQLVYFFVIRFRYLKQLQRVMV